MVNKSNKRTVIKLSELTNYQKGAIVSREIIRKPSGTVTIFAFDKGQGLSEHTASFDAMVCMIDGEAEISISGKISRIKKGEFVILPRKIPHALNAIKKFKMLLIMVKS